MESGFQMLQPNGRIMTTSENPNDKFWQEISVKSLQASYGWKKPLAGDRSTTTGLAVRHTLPFLCPRPLP
jgi:hypothetical protein